jgi:phenylalanyl-tRNA synthetase beta chain
MKASLEWIKELLPDLKVSAASVEKKLNASGTAVDGLEFPSRWLEGVVVGEVRAVEPHPKADKLRVTRVFDGEAEHTVVCGAPNVATGQKAPFAPVGTSLPNGVTIEPRPIRGVESRGMLCSADELQLAAKSNGLMVLKPRLKPGKPLAEALGVKDAIFDLDVTPNRPDLLSHFGLARELAALFELPLPKHSTRLKQARRRSGEAVNLEVHDPQRCPLYSGRVIEGVTVGPSPDWVQRRLLALGQRPVSNVVDATNLVLLELGQPLHAFDLDELAGPSVVVRTARSGEPIRLIDGSEPKLSEDDLVIADAERPVALAGVMGGLDSEVSDGTTRVMLESAQFEAATVRRSSKRHGLHTEASHRFERGVDPEMVQTALDACAALIAELAGGEVLSGRVIADARRHGPTVVGIRPGRAESLIGRPVMRSEIRKVLTRLGLKAVPAGKTGKKAASSSDAVRFTVPSWRMDLSREVDLIEEVARVSGYDQIPVSMPAAAPAVRTSTYRASPERRLRRALAGLGFREAVSLGFVSPRDARIFGVGAQDLVGIRNPLGEETRYLRFSVLPGLLAAARRNQDALPSVTDLHLFELGRAFRWKPKASDVPVESSRLAVLMRGRRRPPTWAESDEAIDVHDLVGTLEVVCERMNIALPDLERDDAAWLHPRTAGRLVSESRVVGRLGQLHPDIMSAYELEGPPVFVAEIEIDALSARELLPTFRPSSAHPPAQRDLSFFVDRDRPAARVLETIRRTGADRFLESVDLFDVYEGRGVPDGRRSLAVALVFRAPERTLTDAEVDEAQAAIVGALEREHDVVLRSGG